jgi:predicted DNA repair protein MutK
MTIGVYGLVAGIVKLDDLGLHLTLRTGATGLASMQRSLGRGILVSAPYLMKTLSVAGTAAMFLVGGGILTHGIPPIHHAIEHLAGEAGDVPGLGGVLAAVLPALINGVFGLLAGALIVGVVMLVGRMRQKKVAH